MNTFVGEITELPLEDKDIILQLSVMCPKLVLTGSISMYMLGLQNLKSSHDIDLALTDPITEDELLLMMSFYDLEVADNILPKGMDYDTITRQFYPVYTLVDSDNKKLLSDIIKGEIIQLRKLENDKIIYKIDIFNRWFINLNDFYRIIYDEVELKITIPAISISQKAMYAFSLCNDEKRAKHFEDIKMFISKYPEYLKVIDRIVKSDIYVQEFNFIDSKTSIYTKIKNKILWLLKRLKNYSKSMLKNLKSF